MTASVNVVCTLDYWEPWGRGVARESFGSLRMFLIRLHCSLSTAVSREQQRAIDHGLSADDARLAWESLHEGHAQDWSFAADLVIDSERSPDELARAVIGWLGSQPVATAFRLL